MAAGPRACRDAEFSEFVQAASPSLLRAALVLLGSREDAEDALQVTMLRTYRRWGPGRHGAPALPPGGLGHTCRGRRARPGPHPENTTDLDAHGGALRTVV